MRTERTCGPTVKIPAPQPVSLGDHSWWAFHMAWGAHWPWKLDGCVLWSCAELPWADFTRLTLAVVPELPTITCLPFLPTLLPHGKAGPAFDQPWLALALHVKASQPLPPATSSATALPSSLLPLDPSPKAPSASKKRQPSKSQPASIGAPVFWPRKLINQRIVTCCSRAQKSVFLCGPALAGSLTDPLNSDSKATGKAWGSSRVVPRQQDPLPMPQRTLTGLPYRPLKPTNCEDYAFFLIQPQSRSPVQDTEGANEARGLTVPSSQIWSHFLWRLIYSFVYFRGILPRKQVRLSALTRGWSQNHDSKQ